MGRRGAVLTSDSLCTLLWARSARLLPGSRSEAPLGRCFIVRGLFALHCDWGSAWHLEEVPCKGFWCHTASSCPFLTLGTWQVRAGLGVKDTFWNSHAGRRGMGLPGWALRHTWTARRWGLCADPQRSFLASRALNFLRLPAAHHMAGRVAEKEGKPSQSACSFGDLNNSSLLTISFYFQEQFVGCLLWTLASWAFILPESCLPGGVSDV